MMVKVGISTLIIVPVIIPAPPILVPLLCQIPVPLLYWGVGSPLQIAMGNLGVIKCNS